LKGWEWENNRDLLFLENCGHREAIDEDSEAIETPAELAKYSLGYYDLRVLLRAQELKYSEN